MTEAPKPRETHYSIARQPIIGRINSIFDGLILSPEITSLIDQFINIIEQRGNTITEQVKTRIINNIRSKKEYTKKEELKRYLKALIKLASKQTIQGKYFIPQKYVEKLADYKNWEKNGITPEKQPQINLIIKAVEKAFLPSTVIDDRRHHNFLFNCSEINPSILKDIQKRMSIPEDNPTQTLIATYPSEMKFILSGKTLPPGTIHSFKNALNVDQNNQLFMAGYGNNTPHWMGTISGKTLFKILPLVGRYYIEQGKTGTCYQLAAYLSIMKDPHFYARTLQRLEEDPKGVLCTLPMKAKGIDLLRGKTKEFNAYNQLFVRFNKSNKFDTPNKEQTVTAKPFYQALEHLYGKYRKYKRANEYIESLHLSGAALQRKIKEVIQNIDQYVYERKNGKRIKYTLQQINKK